MGSSRRVRLILRDVFCFGLLTGCASCNQPDFNVPKGETCFVSAEKLGLLLCENTLTKKEYQRWVGQDKEGKNASADVCTNSDDYFKMRTDYLETKKKYIICKKHPEKCQ